MGWKMSKKLYGRRNIMELNSYMDHASAMTTEKLHSKSDIAAELAFRDEKLKSLLDELEDIDDLGQLSKLLRQYGR